MSKDKKQTASHFKLDSDIEQKILPASVYKSMTLLPINVFLLLHLSKIDPDTSWTDFLFYNTNSCKKDIKTQTTDNQYLIPILNQLLKRIVNENNAICFGKCKDLKNILFVNNNSTASIKQLQLWSESYPSGILKPFSKSTTSKFNEMSQAQKRNYYLQLVTNPEFKSQLELEDKTDESGLIIDSLWNFSQSVNAADAGPYRRLPHTGHVITFLKGMVSLNPGNLPNDSDGIKLCHNDYPHFVSEKMAKAMGISDQKRILKESDMEMKLFESNNFWVDIDIEDKYDNSRGLRYFKIGPLLFTVNSGGKGSGEINVFYLNTKKRGKIHLINVCQGRANNLAALIAQFLPLDATGYIGTKVRLPRLRAFKKTVLATGGLKISNELNKVLYEISSQKSSDTQIDLAKLRPYIKRYVEWVALLIKVSNADTSVKLPAADEIKHSKNSSYFIDRNYPAQIHEYPVNPQEVIEKIMGLYKLNFAISDFNIKAVLCQYFTQEQPQNLDVSKFVEEIYSLLLILERSNLSIIIKKNDFHVYAKKAWKEYLRNPQNKFPLDMDEFDAEFLNEIFVKELQDILQFIGFAPSFYQIIFSYMDTILEKEAKPQVEDLKLHTNSFTTFFPALPKTLERHTSMFSFR